MDGRQILIQELLENLDEMIDVIEQQEVAESDFALVRVVAEQFREEIVALQE